MPLACIFGDPSPDGGSILIFKPAHSLIDQSLSARSSGQTTTGGGFGMGWYSEQEIPALIRVRSRRDTIRNLRELNKFTPRLC